MSATRLVRAACRRRVGGKAEPNCTSEAKYSEVHEHGEAERSAVQMSGGYDWQRGRYDIPLAGASRARSPATSWCVAVNSANSTHRMSRFQGVERECSERKVTERNRASRL